jgi:hypothetical protein
MKQLKRLLPLTVVALVATGCGGISWPPEGRGGWAEHPRLTPLPTHDPVAVAKQRLEQIAWDGGSKLFPGRIAAVRALLTRAEREQVGGLKHDVALTLINADAALDDLAQRLPSR